MALTVLKVMPAHVEMRSGEAQAFEAYDDEGKPVGGVQWSVAEKGAGSLLADSGVYVAPARIYRARKLAIVARKLDNGVETARGSAVVELDPARTWVPLLGAGWIVLFVALLGLLLKQWPELCPQCAPRGIFVSPPVVTLTRGEAQQFLASAEATWTNTVNAAGLYVSPATIDVDQMVRVSATSAADPRQAAEGVVRLSPSAGLAVVPSRMTVHPGQTVELQAIVTGDASLEATWMMPALGTIERKGPNTAEYKAPDGASAQTVFVLARALAPAHASVPASHLLAGALVTIVSDPPGTCDAPCPDLGRLILLVAWVGALGGLTHAMGSFGTYVGNRELKASWLWWYGLKPALSAAVAVLVFLVVRAGFGAPDLGLGAADCLKIAGFAGLVGLFAEPATVKLKDIFEVLFTPRRDPREDKAGSAERITTPVIDDVEQPPGGATRVLRVLGRNFAQDSRVLIGGQQLQPSKSTASMLEVELDPKLTPGPYVLSVLNNPPAGPASKGFSFVLKPLGGEVKKPSEPGATG